MIKEKLYEDLFDKIPENCNIAIFGANITEFLERILQEKKSSMIWQK